MLKEIGKKAKIKVHWKVNPYDFSKEKQNNIISKLSKKYSIPKDKIKVEPEFIMLNSNGENISITSDIIDNIQDPLFQLNLMKEYLSVNDIENYDFDLIKQIDSEINAKIDYKLYEKHKRYSINWVKWDNFLSYGENNYFDFTNLNGLVLLNGEPANQSGKTTFAIDLVHFLLFGKTDKSATQDKIFNKHIPEATKVIVEGSITIEGENFIIKRELSRPSFDKRTSKSRTTQKVSYYRVLVDDTLEELEEYVENYEGEDSRKTNKIIKDAIGNENDFDMIICATSSNLDELIEKKDTERGRLLSRWIGLLPIEEKDIYAREKFNTEIKPYLISNKFNTETLLQENEALTKKIEILSNENVRYKKENEILDKEINESENNKLLFLQSKSIIDENVLKLDITTFNSRLELILNEGKKKNVELSSLNEELEKIGDIEFSIDDYDNIVEECNKITVDIKLERQRYGLLKQEIESLRKSEYCPTCGKKFDDVDNSEKIKLMEKDLNNLVEHGKILSQEHLKMNEKIQSMKIDRDNYNLKNKLVVKKSALELNIEQLRNEYKEKKQLIEEYKKNHDAIDKNNKLDIQIRNIDISLKNKRNTKETNIRYIEKNEQEILIHKNSIEERNELILKISEEVKLLRHWRLYLDMIGKNGISKMVLRKTLPIINAQITNLLSDVCDFTVDIEVTDKNDVMFYLVKDGVKSDLTSGSGFEKTASALALRCVLGNISTLPKNNGLILDEIWGRIAKENYDNMKKLLDKILINYDYIFIISHLDEVKEYCDKIITVNKINNVSKINIIV